MRFFANFIISLVRLILGLTILLFTAAIPTYFTSVDENVLIKAGNESLTPIGVAQIYLDNSKISTAKLIAESANEHNTDVQAQISKLPKDYFDNQIAKDFENKIIIANSSLEGNTVYSALSLTENRESILQYLWQSQSRLVKRFIDLRKMTSVLLPPVYSQAGVLLDSSLISSAMLAEKSSFSTAFLKDLSTVLSNMDSDSAQKDKFEKYCLGMLVLSKRLDWNQLKSIFAHFNNLDDVYTFARLYKDAKNKKYQDVLLASVYMGIDINKSFDYITNNKDTVYQDFTFAFFNGEGSLKYLIEKNKPICKLSDLELFIAQFTSPIKEYLSNIVINNQTSMMFFKIILSIIGGYFVIRGIIRIFVIRRDTTHWFSPLAVLRGILEGAVVSLLFFLLIEPNAFKMKLEDTPPPPEITFAFEKVVNTIKEETMKFETDTATIAAIGLFLILQFIVYIICLIRLSIIKRGKAPAQLKLKLLDNEENLFDLGLYIGLAGTVVSLILLTMGIVTASLMAAYASTLFGILFTATVKIVHVRSYKRKLLFEAQRDA